jgi:aldehyde dehydrogenase (NAD+)
MNFAERRKILLKFSDLMEKHADELAALESLDNGKPLPHSHIDIETGIEFVRYYACMA